MFYAASNLGRTPLNLSGTADSTTISSLQLALGNLARAAQRPAIDPGPVTGTLSDGTMLAIAASFDLLSDQLPLLARAAIDLALLAGSTTTLAKNAVGQYAGVLAAAANATAVQYANNASPSTLPPTMPITPSSTAFFRPGWYKEPYGIAVLVGVGLLIYATVFR